MHTLDHQRQATAALHTRTSAGELKTRKRNHLSVVFFCIGQLTIDCHEAEIYEERSETKSGGVYMLNNDLSRLRTSRAWLVGTQWSFETWIRLLHRYLERWSVSDPLQVLHDRTILLKAVGKEQTHGCQCTNAHYVCRCELLSCKPSMLADLIVDDLKGLFEVSSCEFGTQITGRYTGSQDRSISEES